MKRTCSMEFSATLDSLGISHLVWCSLQNYVYTAHNRPGVRRARKLVQRIQKLHILRQDILGLYRRQ